MLETLKDSFLWEITLASNNTRAGGCVPPILNSHLDTPAPIGPKTAERRVQFIGQSTGLCLGDSLDTGWLCKLGQAT